VGIEADLVGVHRREGGGLGGAGERLNQDAFAVLSGGVRGFNPLKGVFGGGCVVDDFVEALEP
jgi:hypothetical protein